MKPKFYSIENLSFEVPFEDGYKSYTANVAIKAITYLYGDDIDGDRGTWITEREIVYLEVFDKNSNSVTITEEMNDEVQRLIDEKGYEYEGY